MPHLYERKKYRTPRCQIPVLSAFARPAASDRLPGKEIRPQVRNDENQNADYAEATDFIRVPFYPCIQTHIHTISYAIVLQITYTERKIDDARNNERQLSFARRTPL